MDRTLTVTAEWDDEARMWVATSDDVPGLVTEAATMEELIARVGRMVPELLALNQTGGLDRAQSFTIRAARTERIASAA